MEMAKNYHPREKPLNPGGVFREIKKLKDGHELVLECGVSGMEFDGTPAYILKLRTEAFEELLLTRPDSAMLSEPAYRLIMGKIETAEDFRRIREEIFPIANQLRSKIYEADYSKI